MVCEGKDEEVKEAAASSQGGLGPVVGAPGGLSHCKVLLEPRPLSQVRQFRPHSTRPLQIPPSICHESLTPSSPTHSPTRDAVKGFAI